MNSADSYTPDGKPDAIGMGQDLRKSLTLKLMKTLPSGQQVRYTYEDPDRMSHEGTTQPTGVGEYVPPSNTVVEDLSANDLVGRFQAPDTEDFGPVEEEKSLSNILAEVKMWLEGKSVQEGDPVRQHLVNSRGVTENHYYYLPRTVGRRTPEGDVIVNPPGEAVSPHHLISMDDIENQVKLG